MSQRNCEETDLLSCLGVEILSLSASYVAVALPFPQFALLHSDRVQLSLITMVGNCGRVALPVSLVRPRLSGSLEDYTTVHYLMLWARNSNCHAWVQVFQVAEPLITWTRR